MGSSHPEAASAPPPTLFLSDEDVAELADWPAAIAALRQAYAQPIAPAAVPPRSMARGDGLWLRGLSAVSPTGAHMGCKLIAASMTARRASYLVSLFDQRSTALAALIDGNRITGIRTAATAALAVDAAAPRRPLAVAVIGAGFEARGLLSALAAVRALSRVRVYSPTPQRREAFAADFHRQLCDDVQASSSAEVAVAEADVVLCAARSRDETPVLQGRWLAAGATVVSIGSTLPEQREVDVDTLARSALIVADMPDEVAHDTGDMLAARAAGIAFEDRLHPLTELVAGRLVRGPSDIVLYKSVGSALQDVVVAEMLLERALASGRGQALARSIVPIAK